MNVPRLRLLEQTLRNLDEAKKGFVMPEGKSPEKFIFTYSTFGALEPTCETKACACGLAAFIPEFIEAGFTCYAEPDDYGWVALRFKWQGKEIEPEEGACHLFDIPEWLSQDLFVQGFPSATAVEVANEIDGAIRHYSNEVNDEVEV